MRPAPLDRLAAIESALEDCGVVMLDALGNITDWSAGAERLDGFHANEMEGSHFSRCYLPEDVGRGAPAKHLKAAATNGRFSGEAWRVRKDTSRYWAAISIVALRDSAGKLQGFCSVVRDETSRKREREDRERLLKEIDAQRKLFRSVMEHAPSAIAIVDGRNLRMRWANPIFLRMAEAAAWGEDITGLRLRDLLRGADQSGLTALVRQVAADSQPRVYSEFELSTIGPDTSYWHTVVVPLGESGGKPEIMLLMTEVTEQVVSRQKVQSLANRTSREQRFLAMILDTIPVSVTYLDGDLICRQCNAAAARDFGRPVDQVLGRSLHEVMASQPEAWSAIEDVLGTGKAYENPVTTISRPERGEGGLEHLRVAYLPDKDDSGKTVGVFCMRMDITELVAIRRYLEDANRELELRNREVERADRLKSEFLAGMSHELRTPLTSIIGFSELLAEQELTPKQKRQVRHILQGARHLLELINDILDLSKIEAGRMELRKEAFPLEAAVHEVLETLAPLVAAKHLQLSNSAADGLVLAADRVRLKQILYNLLSNAVKFTPEGGRVWIAFEQRDGAVWITVSDSGIGIPVEEQKDIFSEFHQVAAGAKEGAGLGLSITRRLVEMHGGTISVRSAPGEGSQFTFSIPAGVEAQ